MRVLALLLLLVPGLAAAEVELSFYAGAQSAPHSRIDGSGGVVDGDDYLIGWEGRSFDMPPYYGVRATWWRSPTLGFGLDVNHAKVYAPEDDMAKAGYDRLEFTDGLNIVTVNAYRRFPGLNLPVTPYLGAGAGVAVPHVDITKNGVKTYGYQVTGPAVTFIAGASYPLTDRMSLFGEYKGTYSQNTAELDDGGELKTDIITNALNVGVSFRF
ncbi:MAG: lipid A oxidase [Rhodobacterales bacterium]|nr:MAG: lipid A oxidase [Rhodobacterales bacterium]